MSDKNSSFLPLLIENVFEKIVATCKTEKKIPEEQLVELHSLFGSTLERALHILDIAKITLYKPTAGTRELVEVQGKNGQVYKLFPNINYCPCVAFRFHVLVHKSQYTCKHALATKLGVLLDKLEIRFLTDEQFNFLMKEVQNQQRLIKNRKMLTQSQFSQIKFVARIGNIKGIFNSLKAINFEKDAIFNISDNGIRVLVEHFKFVQASVYVPKECFSEFRVPPDEMITFGVNLSVVVDCLSMFSTVETSMKMIYKGEGAPLVLVLEHHGDDDLVTECSIKTKNFDEPVDYNVDDEGSSLNTAIVRGPELANLFNEIDKTAEEIEIFLSSEKPFFRMKTIGVMQSETNVEVAKTSDMMITFTCKSTTSMRYKLSNIRLVLKALLLASKIAIRTDQTGILQLQLMIASDDAAQIYIEYYIVPQADIDD